MKNVIPGEIHFFIFVYRAKRMNLQRPWTWVGQAIQEKG